MFSVNLGKEQHEKILSETITQLEKDGYKVICTNGTSPTCIAFKDNKSVAITVIANKNKSITYLEDTYHMYDKIKRVLFDNTKRERRDVIDEVLDKYKNDGYKTFYMNKKCPDAIAIRNDCVFAVEILGRQKGYSINGEINNKTDLYSMFDGILFKIFVYGSDDVFTETFGKNRGEK